MAMENFGVGKPQVTPLGAHRNFTQPPTALLASSARCSVSLSTNVHPVCNDRSVLGVEVHETSPLGARVVASLSRWDFVGGPTRIV